MARNAIIIAALALAAAGCSHAPAGTGAVEPSASVREAAPGLAGHWQGTVWETGAHLVQGRTPLDLKINDDGTWTGKIGKGEGSGTARLDRRGNLVLSGVAKTADSVPTAVTYTLRGDGIRRWGETVGDFSGRPEHGSVSLRKVD